MRTPPRWSDFDPADKEFLHEVGSSLEAAGALHRNCPEFDLLLSVDSEALPEHLNRQLTEHLAACAACSALVLQMRDSEIAELKGDERERILSRIRTDISKPERGRSIFSWKSAVLALTSILAIAIVMVWRFSGLDHAQPVAKFPAALPKPAAPVELLAVEKPPVVLPASSAIVWRGAHRDRDVAELAAALRPYAQDDYAQAERQLHSVAQQQPASAEARFYLGVTQFYLQKFNDAVGNLNEARKLDPVTHADDVSWFLAAAHQRAGDYPAAERELRSFCARSSPRSASACETLKKFSHSD